MYSIYVLLATNKVLVDTQENLQEKVSTLTRKLDEREREITQLMESRKSKNINTFIIVLVHDFMYNKYPLGLKHAIAEVSAQFKPDNLEFSQRLDEIVTTEEVGISATQGICMCSCCVLLSCLFLFITSTFIQAY